MFSGYTVHIQKANNVTTTHFRGRIDADGTEVDPSSFSGTLGAGDTDVQTALETIDDFVLGGSSTQSVVAFKCILTDVAAASYAADTHILECAAVPPISQGGFTVENASATDLTDRVVIPENGIYELVVSVYANNPNASVRTTPHISFTVETGGTETVLDDEGTTYLRGATGSQQVGAIDHTALVELDVDDRIGVVMRQEGTTDITVVGVKSFFGILKLGGARGVEGPEGPAGSGSTDESVFDAVSFSNATRDLVFGHFGTGTSTIPLDYLDATQDARPNAITSVTVEQGDEVILSGGVYKYLDPVVGTFTKANIATDDDFVRIDGGGSGGGTGVAVDGVDVQYVTNSRSVFVSVQQDDGNDFSDSANIPRGSLTVPGLFEIATAAEVTAGTETDAALTPANMADITGALVTDANLNVNTPANESTSIAASRQAVAEAVASAGRALATGTPEDVAATGETGTGTRAAHGSHVHALGIGDTLQFNADDELSVAITEVIEHLSQQIRYFTSDSGDYSTGGSAAGQVYTTNAYPKNLFKVQAQIRPTTGSIYRAGVYEVASDNEIIAVLGESEDSAELAQNQTHLVKFDLSVVGETDLGVPLDGDERIAVLIRRVGDGNEADTHVRSGGEAAGSPSVSYADARNDFVLINHVIYRHEDPAVGNTTHSHGTSIRGNLRLYYSVTIDHGSLIGSGNVNAAHIDSGSALATEFLRADGSQGALWAVPPGGGGGGTAFHSTTMSATSLLLRGWLKMTACSWPT